MPRHDDMLLFRSSRVIRFLKKIFCGQCVGSEVLPFVLILMEHSMEHESEKTQRFQKWLQDNNAYTHPSIFFDQGEYGSSVFTSTMLNENTTIVSCPFDLIITSKVAKDALQSLTGNPCRLDDREALCTYLVLHSAKCRERISKL